MPVVKGKFESLEEFASRVQEGMAEKMNPRSRMWKEWVARGSRQGLEAVLKGLLRRNRVQVSWSARVSSRRQAPDHCSGLRRLNCCARCRQLMRTDGRGAHDMRNGPAPTDVGLGSQSYETIKKDNLSRPLFGEVGITGSPCASHDRSR